MRTQITYKKRKLFKQYYFSIKYKKYEVYIKLLRYVIKSNHLILQVKLLVLYYLYYLLKFMSVSFTRKICHMSSHYRSVSVFFNLNRLSVISVVSNGLYPGFSRAIW